MPLWTAATYDVIPIPRVQSFPDWREASAEPAARTGQEKSYEVALVEVALAVGTRSRQLHHANCNNPQRPSYSTSLALLP